MIFPFLFSVKAERQNYQSLSRSWFQPAVEHQCGHRRVKPHHNAVSALHIFNCLTCRTVIKFMKSSFFQLVWYKGKTCFVRWFLSLKISQLLHQNVHWIKEAPNDKSVHKPIHQQAISLFPSLTYSFSLFLLKRGWKKAGANHHICKFVLLDGLYCSLF